MLLEAVLSLVGLGLLVFGANRTITSAGELALHYGVSPFFIGVTVISVGTSLPEMTTSIYAALYGAGDIVVGNIIGSEISQITLAVGIVALVAPITGERRNVVVYGGAMTLAMIIMMLTLEDGLLIRSEGFLMMLSYAFFVYTIYTNEGGEEVTEEVIETRGSPRETVPWIAGGLVLVVGGGQLMVSNGIELARLAGVSEYLVGLLTGLGTTLPEIAVASIAAREGEEGISVGSLLGSNITDPVFSLGVGALVADIAVSDPAGVFSSMTYMLAVSIVVLSLFWLREGIDRRMALLCIALYLPSFVVT